MKTLKKWEKSDKDFNEYCPYPCEIDEELFMHFCEILPPNWSSGLDDAEHTFQLGEAQESKEDVYCYDTFTQKGEKFFYIGVLPDFNLIEKEPEEVEAFCEMCPHSY